MKIDNKVEYKAEKTPTLSSISPNKGTTAGGTSVTFTGKITLLYIWSGTGFSTTTSDIKVTLDGIDCPVESSTLN